MRILFSLIMLFSFAVAAHAGDKITTSRKVDAKTFEVTKEETKTTTVKHELKYLKEQRARIVADRAACVATRDKELADIDLLIGEAGKLGIVEEGK